MAMQDGSNKLVSLGKNQTNPYDAKGSDFKAKVPAEGTGDANQDKMVTESANQCGPRHTEDGAGEAGYGKPMPTDRSKVVESNFKPSKNSNESGTAVSLGSMVDFGTGDWTGGVPYKK